MPLPYTGKRGELNFEEDVISLLQKAGWEKEVLKNNTIPELIENWRNIIFERNRTTLNDVPLSDNEMNLLLDIVRAQANTPVKANHFINGRDVALRRDSDTEDTLHAGKEVYIDLFSAAEIAGGSSRYQIAEQTIFNTGSQYNDRRGDITLLINGMPVIHLELKAAGVDVSEASTQIIKYAQEGVWEGFMGLVQVFWAITPEDAIYFANAGDADSFNSSFFFRWGDADNNIIKDWRELITGKEPILSIPEAHKLTGYYTVADTAKDVLKVCRNYQYVAIRAIVGRASRQKWGDHNQLGGFVWCTTGGGKTMTSFKAGQLIIDMNYADKVVFVVDRRVLDEQSAREYNSFARDGEAVCETSSANDLFNKLSNTETADSLIVTSIQKISRIYDDAVETRAAELDAIKAKRIVFIIDEAHRSQFGEMHERVKKTFCNALFFGFTGTPIFPQNMKPGELTTESVFGRCLAVYSLATGIRDGNVLGFWPEAVKTYEDKALKEAVALAECRAKSKDEIEPGSANWKLYRRLTEQTPMASEYDEAGNMTAKGIEDYLPGKQYDNDAHRREVVENICQNFKTIAIGEYGTRFHGLLATASIPEACEYWKLIKKAALEHNLKLNITALFNPDTDTNSFSIIEKERVLKEIVDDYNATFGTAFDKKNDPSYEKFKTDLTSRLAHKDAYKHIGNDPDKVLDLVIVVKQLLTGFDSQWLNVLYLDDVIKEDALIQAISRTNRVYNRDEKPWGMVKFYRKPYTMKKNLDNALKLYCQGDYTEVEVGDILENIEAFNVTFGCIKEIFEHDKIDNFECLPKSDADRLMFKKEFRLLRSLMRAIMLQGFKWNNEYGVMLHCDERTYRILTMRYNDLAPGGGGGGGMPKPGYIAPTDLSTMEMDKIDAAYLEAQFKIITMKDIESIEGRDRKAKAIKEIEAKLALLPEILQRYVRQILKDIREDVLKPADGKTLNEYISQYRETALRKSIHEFAEQIGVNEEELYELYIDGANDIDQLKLGHLEDGADPKKMTDYFGAKLFIAKGLMHKELKDFIELRKADMQGEVTENA